MRRKTTKKSCPGLYDYGRKLEKLGKALQSADVRIDKLSDLAFDCGLELHFAIVDRRAEKPQHPTSEGDAEVADE